MATNPSLVDYLTSSGKDASLTARAKLATDYGLVSDPNQYISLASKGLNADINTKLLGSLQAGSQPKAPAVVTPPAPTYTPPANTSSTIMGGVSSMNQTPMTGSQIEKSTNLPEPTSFIDTTKTKSLSDMVSEVASTTMSSNQLEIDTLRKQLQDITTTEKDAAQAKRDKIEGQINDIVGSTAAQDALDANNKKFQVEQNIALYSDIQSKIVSAQEALNMGLIYEADRPARMKFITGSESTLQKQGLATIGALQGTAAVIKGNLDLAKAFGDATIAAINSDNDRSWKALTTLLDLANNDLVDLTTQERKVIDDRLTAIESEANRLQTNKDDVLDLMTKYPRAFAAGGVTLLDSKEVALQKMLPTMSADETAKFNADLASKSKNTTADTEAAKKTLLDYKSKGMTYDEAITRFADSLSVEYIASVYGRKATGSSGEDVVTDAYYNQFLDPATGSLKEGYSVSIDPKNGRPIVEKTAAQTEGFWSNIGQAFGSLFK